METHEYRRMFTLEEHHWWFRSRLLMIEAMLDCSVRPHLRPGPRLLDLGCGTGRFLARREAEMDAVGLDFSAHALGYARQRTRAPLVRGDAGRLPLADAAFDIVTAFDLIEHLHDDRGLIAEIHRVLRPGGFLVASVPAHPHLWTGHDVSLHHHRRYTRDAFESLFTDQPWQPLRMTAGFTLIFPPAAAIRIGRRLLGLGERPVSDTRPTAEWLNRLLTGMHRLEAAWLARYNLPIGVSLFTIRRKPPLPGSAP